MTTRPASANAAAHRWTDDAQALGSATLVIALGLHLLSGAGLMVGGVPGLAFLLRYSTGLPLGLCLFVVNLPFYALAWRALGGAFTLKTLAAVSLLSLAVEAVRRWLTLQAVHPALGAVAGGLLVGVGLLMLLRHRASVGGIGILALHLQRRCGWNLGAVQFALDAVILSCALVVVEPSRLGWSVLAAAVMNLVLYWNNRPGRYLPGERLAT
jgi:uncharacterized membrane-anchored protein YitT (DUF2179 family)